MPRNRILLAAMLAVAGVVPTARGQDPAALPAAAAGGGQAITIQAAGPPKTIWNCLGISSAGCAAFKQRLCGSQFGQLLNNGMAPISGISGGLIPQFCPTVPTPAQVAAASDKNANPAMAQATKIKAEEAQAKQRVAAVEYLGTVDCRRFPDAKEALLKALREDTNECVRYAAARVLINGCCCSKKIVAALTVTVMGPAAYNPVTHATPDGPPVETSERVRCAAMMALQNCLANPDCIIDDEKDPLPEPPPEKKRGEVGPGTSPPPKPAGEIAPTGDRREGLGRTDEVRLASYHTALARKPISSVVRDGQRALDLVGNSEPSLMTPGNRTLANVIARSRGVSPKPVQRTAPAPKLGKFGPAPVPLQEDTNAQPTQPEAMTPLIRTPAFLPAPTSAPVRDNDARLPRVNDEEDDLPPLPPLAPGSTSAAPAQTAEPVAVASYRPTAPTRTPATPVNKPRKVVRVAPEPTPMVNPLIDRFSRTPDSFRGDIQR